jgi:hypothetical protein
MKVSSGTDEIWFIFDLRPGSVFELRPESQTCNGQDRSGVGGAVWFSDKSSIFEWVDFSNSQGLSETATYCLTVKDSEIVIVSGSFDGIKLDPAQVEYLKKLSPASRSVTPDKIKVPQTAGCNPAR